MENTNDANLEQAISEAGREKVFAIVMAAGWTPGDSVPRYVWKEAVRMAKENPPAN